MEEEDRIMLKVDTGGCEVVSELSGKKLVDRRVSDVTILSS